MTNIIDGVSINVGQTWATGSENVSIVKREGLTWHVITKFGRRWRVNDFGRYVPPEGDDKAIHSDVYDLQRLISVTDALTDPPGAQLVDPRGKETNPKEAIGETKVPLWLCSAIAKAHWAAGQFAGLLKYGAWNWRAAGVRTSTYLSAIGRHVDAYENGEQFDPVDGTHHLGNVMACCAILLEAEAIGKLNDDRPPRADVRPTYEQVQAMMAKLKEMYVDKTPRHYTINDKV